MCVLLLLILIVLVGAAAGARRWDLGGKNVVVTGGTKGIGRSIVDEMAEEALHAKCIVTCSRSAEDLAECAKQWRERGFDHVKTIVADVSTQQGRADLVAFCEAQFGDEGLDVLVNNVGSNIRKKAVEYSDAEYQKIMSTNLESAFCLSTALHPLLAAVSLKSQGSRTASVVNIGSVAGGCGTAIRSGTIYAMTKAALAQMSMNLGCEWASDGIRVNSVSPWYIMTPLAAQVLKDPEYLKKVLDRTPMKRTGTVQEVADVVIFLAMDASSYVTGQNIAVDGGFLRCGECARREGECGRVWLLLFLPSPLPHPSFLPSPLTPIPKPGFF